MLLGDRQVALFADYASDNGFALGDTVPVSYSDGASDEPTVGAIFDNDELVGNVVLPKAAYAPHAATRASDVTLLIDLVDGVSTADGEAAIQPVADRFGAPDGVRGPDRAARCGVALGAVVGVVGAARPARRAARLDVLQAIATD